MTTITRERVAEIIHAAGLEPCDYEDVFGSIKTGEIVAMARIALASLTAEPVLYAAEEALAYANMGELHLTCLSEPMGDAVIPLYTATPAPVVHQEPIAWLNDAYLARGVVDGEAGSEDAGPGYIPVYREPLYAVQPVPVVPEERAAFNAWNNDTDCPLSGLTVKQAAWLAWLKRSGTIKSFGNDEEFEPVSNRDELPVIGWLRSDYNSDDKCDPNAPLFMLGRNDPSETWGVKYIPLTGNSPVIPDGYVVVPVEPTMAMLDEFDSIIDYGAEDSKEAWCRLIAAAPQQEVK